MTNKQSLQTISIESAFNIISPILFTMLQLKFSNRYNAVHGPTEFFSRLFEMCQNKEYAETANSSDPNKEKNRKIPSGKWILDKIRPIRYDYMLKRCQAVTHRTVCKMRRHGMFKRPIDMAIDKHLVCRYDKFGEIINTIKSKSKKGTSNFNCLATANCINEGSRAFLAVRVVRRINTNAEIVSGLIEDCRRKRIKLNWLKVDREFFSVDVINMLKDKKVSFMVPARKTKGIKKAVKST